jgi:hypothetical protein
MLLMHTLLVVAIAIGVIAVPVVVVVFIVRWAVRRSHRGADRLQ